MAEINLHKKNGTSATEIPNRFIDEYMTNANGEFVKIYLYLLRCMNSPGCSFSISRTADKFDHTEKDIRRALTYWEKMNLLRLEYDGDKSISGIYLMDPDTAAMEDDMVPLKKAEFLLPPVSQDAPYASGMVMAFQDKAPYPDSRQAVSIEQADYPSGQQATAKEEEPPALKKAAKREKTSYTPNQLAALKEQEEVRELLFVAESYLARPLSPTDIQSLLYWYDGLGLCADLIVYLMEYCIAGGHSSLHYMEKVALNWKEAGIATVEQAKRSSSSHSKLHYAVMKALGIHGRSLIPAESAYIDKWSKELGFGQDIITEACSRTILNIHQPNFDYTDRILRNWKNEGIRTPSDIKKADASFHATKTAGKPAKSPAAKTAAANRFNSFPQRTYNLDKLEAELLTATR